MLTEQDLQQLKEIEKQHGIQQQKVLKEIDRVFKVIGRFFNHTVTNYWFPVKEGGLGELVITDIIEFEEIQGDRPRLIPQAMYKYIWPLEAKFLFMSDEEITDLLQKDKNAEEVRLNAKKNKAAEKKELRKQALSKLTPKERKLLGIKP